MARRSASLVLAGLLIGASGCSLLLDFGAGGGDGGGDPISAIDADVSCDATTVFHADADGDGHGDPAVSQSACVAPEGHVADSTDCDDGSAARHPGAVEGCDGLDNDCNFVTDDGACITGCADGEREGYLDAAVEPNIAACAGGFGQPGLLTDAPPTCGRGAGDDADPLGPSCRSSDLCTDGWHVCLSPAEVAARASTGSCAGAVPAGAPEVFFAIRGSGPGFGECGDGANDLYGCGNVGQTPMPGTCAPLDRFSGDLCADIGASWSCGPDNLQEATNVRKLAPAHGGVLCCRDRP